MKGTEISKPVIMFPCMFTELTLKFSRVYKLQKSIIFDIVNSCLRNF